MPKTFTRAQRAASGRRRQGQILTELRGLIGREVWRSGQQLPTRRDLEARFSASSVTIQRALNRLSAGGFIETRSREGTYVTARPPNVSRYGLVFPFRPLPDQPLSRNLQAMQMVAPAVAQAMGADLRVFYDVTHRGDLAGDYARLLHAVEEHQVAGLVFACSPHPLIGSPVLTTPGLPRVAVMGGFTLPGVAPVILEPLSFHRRALDHLRERGCKRVALVAYNWDLGLQAFEYEAKQRGMTVRPYWMQGVGSGEPQLSRNLVHLLMHHRQEERPDGLVIGDDHLVEGAQAGLIDAGLSVPTDVEVVGYANFPNPPARVLPITLLGIDTRALLAECIRYVDALRRSDSGYRTVPIPSRFEHELTDSL